MSVWFFFFLPVISPCSKAFDKKGGVCVWGGIQEFQKHLCTSVSLKKLNPDKNFENLQFIDMFFFKVRNSYFLSYNNGPQLHLLFF